MNIFGHENCPELLLKVGKLEHLEALCKGKLYMNESGYFRKLDDNYRGDKYDGKCPMSMAKSGTPSLFFWSLDNSENKVEIPAEQIKSFISGFKGDDKIPLFCCCQIDEDILIEESENKWSLKKEFVKEMEQFGEYYLLMSKHELLRGILDHTKNTGIKIVHGKVEYTDIDQEYGMDLLTDPNRNYLQAFFKKDNHYKWQNEWRVCLINEEQTLIDEESDHYIVGFEPLTYAIIAKVEDLHKQTITVYPDE